MIELVIVGEGQTEERFVTEVLGPALASVQVYATPRTIPTSPTSRGGGLSFDRVKRALRNTLRERDDTFVTTFFDLYALGPTFRGLADTKGRTPTHRAPSGSAYSSRATANGDTAPSPRRTSASIKFASSARTFDAGTNASSASCRFEARTTAFHRRKP